MLEAVDEVIAACRTHGVAPGVNCASLEDAQDMIERGVRCLSFFTDRGILIDAYHRAMRGLAALTGDRTRGR